MSDKSEEHIVVYVIGCPGSGKGTLCQRLAEEYGFYHLSIGDLLRSIVQQRQATGDEIDHCVRTGSLVPTKSLAPILETYLATQKDLGYRLFLIDGFPRHPDQIDHISAVTGKPNLVLFFHCPKQVAKVRVLTRKLGNRVDNEDMFESRYTEFCMNNPFIVDQYREMGILLQVDTSSESSLSYVALVNALKGLPIWQSMTSKA